MKYHLIEMFINEMQVKGSVKRSSNDVIRVTGRQASTNHQSACLCTLLFGPRLITRVR